MCVCVYVQAHDKVRVWQVKVTEAEQSELFHKDAMGKLRQEKDDVMSMLEAQVAKVVSFQSQLAVASAERSAADRQHAEEIEQFKVAAASLTRQVEVGHEHIHRSEELTLQRDTLQAQNKALQDDLAQATTDKDHLTAMVAELSAHIDSNELVIDELRTKCEVATAQVSLIQSSSRPRQRTLRLLIWAKQLCSPCSVPPCTY
jgi:hypothetical protein